MVKLYYATGACSLAPHIALAASGLPYELEKVELGSEKIYAVNPKGYVPALALDDNSILTEGQVVLQYIADQAASSSLIPSVGSIDRYRVQEWLAYISSEIHKGVGPLFNKALAPELREAALTKLVKRLEFIEKHLAAGNEYLHGGKFTVADAYLFTVLSWRSYIGIEGVVAKLPALESYLAKVAALPAVQQAMKEEGLIQ